MTPELVATIFSGIAATVTAAAVLVRLKMLRERFRAEHELVLELSKDSSFIRIVKNHRPKRGGITAPMVYSDKDLELLFADVTAAVGKMKSSRRELVESAIFQRSSSGRKKYICHLAEEAKPLIEENAKWSRETEPVGY